MLKNVSKSASYIKSIFGRLFFAILFYLFKLYCLCNSSLCSGTRQQRFKAQLQNKQGRWRARYERDKMKSLEMLGCVRENWVSSPVRHTLAEPAPLSHLQVSPRQERGSAGAGWDGCCHEWCRVFMQVPCANNTGALRFRFYDRSGSADSLP